MRSHQLLTCFLLPIILILQPIMHVRADDNFEFELGSAMLISSVRRFEQMSQDLFVSQERKGSVMIKAPPGFGLMAVLQSMDLKELSQPARCLDYIKMSQVNGSEESKEICGHLGSHASIQLPRRPSFVDKSGWIEVDYVLHEERIDSFPLDDNTTNFNISFTPFTECPEEAFPFGNEELRPCSLLDTFSCIPADYFCDGVVNCGFPHEFGLDEANCPLLTIKDEEDEDYVILEDDHIKNVTPSKTYIQFMLWRSSNRMNWGMFTSFTLLVLLYSLVKSRRSGGGGRTSLVIERLDVNTKSDGGSSYQVESLDAEKESAPSYLECLLDTPPVYSELSYEYERPPPTYEQIKVHKNHTKL